MAGGILVDIDTIDRGIASTDQIEPPARAIIGSNVSGCSVETIERVTDWST